MSSFWLTVIAAVLLLIVAVLLFLVGWLITGKIRLRKMSCGKFPQKRGEEERDESCSFCGKTTSCDKDEKKP